jgi:hypothetical protein
MPNPTIETLSQTEVMRRDEMKEPDDVSAMLRPKRNVSTTLRQWPLEFRLGFLRLALVG